MDDKLAISGDMCYWKVSMYLPCHITRVGGGGCLSYLLGYSALKGPKLEIFQYFLGYRAYPTGSTDVGTSHGWCSFLYQSPPPWEGCLLCFKLVLPEYFPKCYKSQNQRLPWLSVYHKQVWKVVKLQQWHHQLAYSDRLNATLCVSGY